jgi:succinate dehydrogenase / fumarate reductase cytochrome b subunit
MKPTEKCGCRKLLWIRKTHSACGLMFGLFLLEHLAATALGLKPVLFGRYMQFVDAVLAEAPWLKAVVLAPLAVASLFGCYLLAAAGLRYQVKKCNRGGKLRYWLQRTSAVVVLLFLAFHLWTLRDYTMPADEDATQVFIASAQGFQSHWPPEGSGHPLRAAAVLCVLLGTWASVYHMCNGLWSAAIAWGFLETPAAQARWNTVCLAIGLVLAILGMLGWVAFATVAAIAV